MTVAKLLENTLEGALRIEQYKLQD